MTDFNCGLHSGIPICCIMYYISVWKPDFETIQNLPRLNIEKVYYVPCPTCTVNIMEGNLKPSETERCVCTIGMARGISPLVRNT